MTTTIRIAGMSCGHCVAAVKRELQKIKGLEVQEVEIGTARVTFDPHNVRMEQITAAIEEAGYAVLQA